MKRTKPLYRLAAAFFLLTGLVWTPRPGHANQDIESIRTEIGRFVQGVEQKDMNRVLGVFNPGASWAGHDLVMRMKAETEEIFALWNDIRLKMDGFTWQSKNGYVITETTFNIHARVMADGSPEARNQVVRWLWQKTPEGWRVIGDNGFPGPEIPEARPPMAAEGGDNNVMPTSIEVIGFGIRAGSKEEQQLKDVASAGGGRYLAANDADDLIKVLTKTVERTVQENTPQKAPAPAPPTVKSDSWESLGGPADKGRPRSFEKPSSPSKEFQSLKDDGGNWQPLDNSQRDIDSLRETPRRDGSSY